MNLEYKHILPRNFSPQSRVWVYQSSRRFSINEALEIEDMLNDFCSKWQSHGNKVTAYGNLFFGQFLVLISDECEVAVSGCSTDSSVRFVKDLGTRYGIDFFNRTNLAFVVKDNIQLLPLAQAQYAIENSFINSDTLYFNNMVQSLEELGNAWIVPVKESWLSRKLKFPVNS
jgi:hypothetical protein